MPPFLVVQIDPPTREFCGDHYYRTYVPLSALANASDLFLTISLTSENRLRDQLLRTAHIAIINLVADVDLIPLVRYRKRLGLPTIYEWNDDICNVPYWNPLYGFFSRKWVRRTIFSLAALADALQFSSDYLAAIYGKINKRHKVFLNHMLHIGERDLSMQADCTEIGYGGSAGHLYDVASIVPYLVPWLQNRQDVRFNLMADSFVARFFHSLDCSRFRYFPTGSIYHYYSFLNKLHIGIAPLLDIPFNRARSDVKFLEYAAHGIAPILQDIEPYRRVVVHGRTGFLFRNSDECIGYLEMLVRRPDLRKKIALRARDYVQKKRMMVSKVKERESFYLSLLSSRLDRSCTGDMADTIWEQVACTNGARVEGRYVLLLPSDYELSMRAGYSELACGNAESAYQHFLRAAKKQPEQYLPYLGASQCVPPGPERIKLLKKALRLNPGSTMAKLLLRGSDFF